MISAIFQPSLNARIPGSSAQAQIAAYTERISLMKPELLRWERAKGAIQKVSSFAPRDASLKSAFSTSFRLGATKIPTAAISQSTSQTPATMAK